MEKETVYKKFYRLHREKRKQESRDYFKLNPNAKKTIERARIYRNNVRASLIEILGFKCIKCGFSDIRALQIDHINGGGAKELKSIKGLKSKYILNKILNGSKEYQLLCANCNWIKRFENKEVRK